MPYSIELPIQSELTSKPCTRHNTEGVYLFLKPQFLSSWVASAKRLQVFDFSYSSRGVLFYWSILLEQGVAFTPLIMIIKHSLDLDIHPFLYRHEFLYPVQ